MADECSAGTRDQRPNFPLPLKILPSVEQLYSKFAVSVDVETQVEAWQWRFPQRQEIAEIIRDLSVTTQWFEVEAARDPYFYQPSNISGDWLVPMVHRCLDLILTDIDAIAEPGFELQETLRHVVVLFTQPIRRRFAINPGSSDLRVQKLRGILQRHLNDWDGFTPLLRWIVVAGGMEANRIEDQLWFAGILATHSHFQYIGESDHLESLRSFIWMNDVFEEGIARLMSQVAVIRDSLLIQPMTWPDFAACNGRRLPGRTRLSNQWR